VKKLGGGGRSAPPGSAPELGQALGDPLSFGLLVVISDEGEAKNLPMLRFRGAPVLGRPYAQAADDIVIQVANRERRHRKPLCCQKLQ